MPKATNGVDVSVLLPTVRPHLWRRAFESIERAAGDVSYEVVVIADFMPEERVESKLIWAVQARQGVTAALNAGCQLASGECLFSFNDESVLEPGSLQALYERLQVDEWQLLSPRHVPHWNFEYYGLPFVPFPFATRELLTMLGGLADPAYKVFYSDPDLSLRAHAHGIPVEVVEEAVIYHTNNVRDPAYQANWADYRAIDQETFRTRWAHLGPFHDN